MNINYLLRYLPAFTVSILLSLIINTMAQAENVRQEMKCHVELSGGNETIYYSALLTNETLSQASLTLENRKILTTLSPQKISVHKVKECVLNNDRFSSTQARYVESLMAL